VEDSVSGGGGESFVGAEVFALLSFSDYFFLSLAATTEFVGNKRQGRDLTFLRRAAPAAGLRARR
jgi:hypothetical protein